MTTPEPPPYKTIKPLVTLLVQDVQNDLAKGNYRGLDHHFKYGFPTQREIEMVFAAETLYSHARRRNLTGGELNLLYTIHNFQAPGIDWKRPVVRYMARFGQFHGLDGKGYTVDFPDFSPRVVAGSAKSLQEARELARDSLLFQITLRTFLTGEEIPRCTNGTRKSSPRVKWKRIELTLEDLADNITLPLDGLDSIRNYAYPKSSS